MPQQEAGVVPFQPWNTPGHAEVAPLPPSPSNPSIVPLEHQPSGNFTVRQDKYFAGLVIIPSEASKQPPDTMPTTLPLESTSQKQITVDVGGSGAPNGVVVLFSSKK